MKYLSVSRAGWNSLPIALAALLLWGCAGFLGEEALIENPDLPGTRALVLSASFTNADTLLTMHIDRAVGVFSSQVGWDTLSGGIALLDNTNEADSRGFRAELSEEGTPMASFSYTDEEIVLPTNLFTWTSLRKNYVTAAGGSVFREGRRYTLELEHPELGTYSMSQVMPQAVTSAQLVMGPLTFDGNSGNYPCRLSFQPPNSGGYYAVSLYYGRPWAGEEITWLNLPYASLLFPTDPRVLQGVSGRSLFFSGADFGAGPISVDFMAAEHITGLQVAGYSVMAITKEAYLTLRSFNQFVHGEGANMLGNFTDPFEIYSNVPRGHGFFLLGNIRFFDY